MNGYKIWLIINLIVLQLHWFNIFLQDKIIYMVMGVPIGTSMALMIMTIKKMDNPT